MAGITDYLISAGRKVSQNTVSDYVEALTESFIFYIPLPDLPGQLENVQQSGNEIAERGMPT